MGNGLLGIFIVTIVIIVCIYILRALTARKAELEEAPEVSKTEEVVSDPSVKKESAMDLMKEREKKDFLETDDTYTISNDL